MSGGSYDYLCYKGPDELVGNTHNQENLERMAARLAGLGYAKDAACETEELLLVLRKIDVRLQSRIQRLAGIWKAIEWWDSCDASEEWVKSALAEYRQKGAG